jgi:tetratricopeptide (TPR) repeat protein
VQKEISNKRGIATELNNLGVILENQGNLALALKTDEQTRDAYVDVGDKDGLSSALNNIAQIMLMQGNLAGAKDYYDQSFALRKELGNESDAAESMHNLAEVIGDQGDVTGAMKEYDAALAIRTRLGLDGDAAQTRLGKAQLLLDNANPRDAEPLIRAAIQQCKKEQQLSGEMLGHAALSKALLKLGTVPEATSEIAIAKGLEKNGSYDDRIVADIVAAQVRAVSDPASAMRDLQAVIQQTAKSGHVLYEMEAALVLGEVEMNGGKRNAGLARLHALENTAKMKGFVLIARQASAGTGNPEGSR